MNYKPMEYQTPTLYEHEMFVEGILCISGDMSESYGGDPDEDDSIF